MKGLLGEIVFVPKQGGGVQLRSVVDGIDHVRGLSETQALALVRQIIDALYASREVDRVEMEDIRRAPDERG